MLGRKVQYNHVTGSLSSLKVASENNLAYCTEIIKQVVAEMVGTFILMFCVCGIIASTQLLRGEVGLMEYASTAGLTVVVVIFSIGTISGAHVNPAVTVAFATLGHFPWSRVLDT